MNAIRGAPDGLRSASSRTNSAVTGPSSAAASKAG